MKNGKNGFKVAYTVVNRSGKKLWLRIGTAFTVVDKHLAVQSFIVGDRPTVADFSLIGYLFFPLEETGYDLPKSYPHIAAWIARMAALPGWKDPYDLLPGERIKPRAEA